MLQKAGKSFNALISYTAYTAHCLTHKLIQEIQERSEEKRMTTAGVSGMMFPCVFEGSLSMQDMEIERRPYHKNCSCALHKSKAGVCSNACPQKRNISFPKKQSWTDGSLCMQAAAISKFSSPLIGDMSTSTSTSTENRECVNEANSLMFHTMITGELEEIKRSGIEKQF